MNHTPNIEGDTYFYLCPECGHPMKRMTWEQERLHDLGCPRCGIVLLNKFKKIYYDDFFSKKEEASK